MNIEQAIKKCVETQISEKIDEEIIKEVTKFHNRLVNRKDEYLAEIMKGIRIISEQDNPNHIANYKIQFENIVRLEKVDD